MKGTTTSRKKKSLEKKCRKLLREIAFTREPNCVACGSPTQDPHHFIPQSLCKHLQLEIDNIVSLCRDCHIALEFRKDPEITRKILLKRGEEWAEELNRKRGELRPSSWNVVYLEGKLEELTALLALI